MATKRNPVGRPPKQENQAVRILEHAAKLFATKGFDRCTMNDIASSLNMTKAAVYHYYASKQSIFDAIRETNIQDLHDHVLSKIDPDSTSTQQLKDAMRAHAEYFENNYWRMVAQISGHSGLLLQNFSADDGFLDQRKRYENLIKKILRRGVRSGEFRKLKVGATSRAILSMINWMARWYQPGGPKHAEQLAVEYFDVIFRGIAA